MAFDRSKPYTLDRIVRIGITVGILYGLFRLVEHLSSVLVPFMIAMLLAYLIYPMVTFFQEKVFKRRLISVIVSLLLITIFIVGIFWLIIPAISMQIEKMGMLIKNLINNENGGALPEYLVIVENYILELVQKKEIQDMLNLSNAQQILERILPGIMGIFSGSLSLVMSLVGFTIILFYVIFILIDYDEVTKGWQEFVPRAYREPILRLLEDLRDGMATYFRAQSLIVLAVSILFSIGFTIIGLPLGILLGIFVGLLNYVPYLQNLGFIPALFLTVIYSLETGGGFWAMCGLVLLVFTVVQLIQDAILTPKIMGDATGLNPAAMLLSLSVWGQLLGLLGLLIAIPITSIMISYYRRFLSSAEQKNSTIIIEPHMLDKDDDDDDEPPVDKNRTPKIIIPN
jgi:predicted PurR-regulated permease PerM